MNMCQEWAVADKLRNAGKTCGRRGSCSKRDLGHNSHWEIPWEIEMIVLDAVCFAFTYAKGSEEPQYRIQAKIAPTARKNQGWRFCKRR
jgi:hypothetical protein